MVERAIKARRHKPVVMVDLAVPRDIEAEVKHLNDVYLYTVDDLATVVRTGQAQRQAAVHQQLLAQRIHVADRQCAASGRDFAVLPQVAGPVAAHLGFVVGAVDGDVDRLLRGSVARNDRQRVVRHVAGGQLVGLVTAQRVAPLAVGLVEREGAVGAKKVRGPHPREGLNTAVLDNWEVGRQGEER